MTAIVLLAAAPAHATPLPGLLTQAEIDQSRGKAAQQKRDAQAMVRRRATKLGFSAAEIDRALKPAMLREGKFRVTLHGEGVEGVVVEFPWYRIGFAENAISNTDKVSAQDRLRRFETNKGGVRLHKGVFRDEVYALALKMDTKLGMSHDGLQGHAVRGAKGGIGPGTIVHVPKGVSYEVKVGQMIDPASKLVPRDAVMRGFGRAYMKESAVGPGLDVQAGDVNTKAPEMKVLSETYGTAAHPSAGVSGKAVIKRNGEIDPKGGIAYRATSTGDGVWMSASLAAHRVGLDVKGATVVAQGWGEVGKAFAESAMRAGARVIAVQELFNVDGQRAAGVIELPAALQRDARALATFKKDIDAVTSGKLDLRTYKDGALLKYFKKDGNAADVKADIVGLNAMGGALTRDTVPRYVRSGTHRGRRKILVEGANLAADAAGAARLANPHYQKWLISVPGDLANVGGVHVSNLEAVQNAYGEVVTSPTAQRSLQKTIEAGWKAAMDIAKRHNVSEREAIELAAVDAMMKRSLHRNDAPVASVDDAVISAKARHEQRGSISRWVERSLAHAEHTRTRTFRGGLTAMGDHLLGRDKTRGRGREMRKRDRRTKRRERRQRSSLWRMHLQPRKGLQAHGLQVHGSSGFGIHTHTAKFTPRFVPRRMLRRGH